MREIKFRAIKDDMSNCSFVYGQLVFTDGIPRITEDGKMFHTCLKGTVGQFTGLTDDNGEDIYEGDILYNDDTKQYSTVSFEDGCFNVNYKESGRNFLLLLSLGNLSYLVGNIHENPELLKEQIHD